MITYCVTNYPVTEEAIRKWESVRNPQGENRIGDLKDADVEGAAIASKQGKGVSFTSIHIRFSYFKSRITKGCEHVLYVVI